MDYSLGLIHEFELTSCVNCLLRGSDFSTEVKLLKSELTAKSATKRGIDLVNGCDLLLLVPLLYLIRF